MRQDYKKRVITIIMHNTYIGYINKIKILKFQSEKKFSLLYNKIL